MKTIVLLGLVLGALSAAGKVFKTNPGMKFTLECGVKVFTNTLVWKHRNELIIGDYRKSNLPRRGPAAILPRTKLRQEVNLEISKVMKEDAGKFTCEADGKPVEHTLIVVSVSANPPRDVKRGSNLMLNCEVSGLQQDLTVQWKRPNGGMQKGPNVVLDQVTPSDAGTWECVFNYDAQTFSEGLVISVIEPTTPASSSTQSSKGDHKPDCPTCNTGPALDISRLHWWVWAVVGVGCLVVLLLIVLAIILCKKIRRRKKRFLKMKNSQHPLRPKQYCQCNRPTAAARPQQGRQKGKPSALPLQPLLME